jgi:hypothetical protein
VTRPLDSSRVAAGIVLVCALAACGGTSTAPPPLTLGETPAAATSSTCFTPSTSAQTVALPATAGFTGTLSVAAATASAASCDVTVTVATGTAVNAPAVQTAANARSAQAVNPTAGPILDLSMSNAFANNVAVTGAVLNTPPNLTFPDGTYYALIVSGTLPPTVLVFTASGGVLTLQSTGQPIIVVPGTTSTLYLYARGVMPSIANAPSPSPSPAPSSSASAAPSASPTAGPTATPTAMPVPSPTPTPAPGMIVASSITLSPGACIQFGNAPGSQLLTAIAVTNAPPGTAFEYGWVAQDVFTITVPGTTQTILNQTVGFSNTATVNSPGFPQGSLFGSGASALVYLYLPPVPPSLTPTPVLTAAGYWATASVPVDGGTITCPN